MKCNQCNLTIADADEREYHQAVLCEDCLMEALFG
jgi:hypothetical protein